VPAITYQRRRPERTTLYEVVRDNVETLYEALGEGGATLPGFVREELRRGFCPSCMGRRMAETAANLTESVLPERKARSKGTRRSETAACTATG
jgi:hypothetical protein